MPEPAPVTIAMRGARAAGLELLSVMERNPATGRIAGTMQEADGLSGGVSG